MQYQETWTKGLENCYLRKVLYGYRDKFREMPKRIYFLKNDLCLKTTREAFSSVYTVVPGNLKNLRTK